MKNLLAIDEARTVRAVGDYIRRVVEGRSLAGVMVGLSGGIDSALLAALAVRALGVERVHAIYLHDRLSLTTLGQRSREVADWLGIDCVRRSIEEEMKQRGAYRSFGMRMVRLSGVQNRLFFHACRLVFGESAYNDCLRAGMGEPMSGSPIKRWLQTINRHAVEAAGMKHRYRREVAEGEAERRGLQFIGSGNRSEWLVGYFTKDAIDDVEIQPIGGLYKTQVRQLSAFLDVPEAVRRQPPSPDGAKGLTDEFHMGITYRKIDLALDHMAGGLTRDEIAEAGCTDADVALVRTMHDLSAWKRRPTGYDYPIDGGPRSPLRLSGEARGK